MTPEFANRRARTEQLVADCWREVLGLAAVDPRRNFFDLGGTSVHAILLHSKLSERLPGCEFSLMTIFKHPTIAEFLDAVVTDAGPEPEPLPQRLPAASGSAGMSPQERAQQQRMATRRPPWAPART